MPRPFEIPISAIPIVPAVPQLVPVAKDVIEHIIKVAARKILGFKIANP